MRWSAPAERMRTLESSRTTRPALVRVFVAFTRAAIESGVPHSGGVQLRRSPPRKVARYIAA
eukprot:3669221-Alexandrium_andersonii.AAC.1